MKYPRVLVVVMGRINAADNFNNGLLLRNLFARWPKENLAQIYSGGDNGDAGYFGHYYKLGPRDRRLGWLFYKLKSEALKESAEEMPILTGNRASISRVATLRVFGNRMLMDTGLYELIFRPRLSRAMTEWVEYFRPDFIFAQGYNLAFTWLPLMLAKRFRLPIVYYPTDDWSENCYRPELGSKGILARLARRTVIVSARQLVDRATVCLAFNPFMQEEYRKRYDKEFTVLMHGDDVSRFETMVPCRQVSSEVFWIVSTGSFDRHRLPLLFDLDEACGILSSKGFNIRATVFPVQFSQVAELGNKFRFIQFQPCPSHDALVSVLRAADVLFLPERFDETASLIRSSVSSKAHLFMFSGRPIVVYSDPMTGIVRYAREDGWAAVVDRRDPLLLAQTFEVLITREDERQRLLACAQRTAMKNHHLPTIQTTFYDLLCSVLP